MIHFDDDVGLYADDIETVREQVKELFLSAFSSKGVLNTDPETPAGQLIDGFTALIVAKDSEVMYLANQFNPQTASGVWQEALARLYYLDKNFATGTVVTCVCYGLAGTVIPAGSIVQDSNGNQYASAEAMEIEDDGSVSIDFTCTETGSISCAAGQITKIVTVTPGWDSVENLVSGIPGSDEEGQGTFERRRYNSVAGNAHGSAYSVQCALKKISDIKDAKVLDNRTDETVTISGVDITQHSVSICVMGGTSDEIGEVIYQRLDAGVGTGGSPHLTSTYYPVSPSSGDNPSSKGWYEKQTGGTYVLTTDTTVVSGKTYYTKTTDSEKASYTPVPEETAYVGAEIPFDYQYRVVAHTTADNPVEKGWYQLIDGEYVLSEHTVAKIDVTYYERLSTTAKRWYKKTATVNNYYNNYSETTVQSGEVYFTRSVVEVQKITYEAEDSIEHEYTIIRPVPTPIYLYVTIQYTSKTKATVEEDIRSAIYEDFIGNSDNAVVGLGDTIYASRFSVPIIKDADFDGLIGITISKKYEEGGTDYTTSISLDATEYPTLEETEIYIQIEKVE